MTEDDSNIIGFPLKTDDDLEQMAGFLLEKKQDPFCYHNKIMIYEQERECRCDECGVVIEPFDYLLDIGKGRAVLAGDITALRKEEQRLRENVDKLLKLEKNAKARLKRRSSGAKVMPLTGLPPDER